MNWMDILMTVSPFLKIRSLGALRAFMMLPVIAMAMFLSGGFQPFTVQRFLAGFAFVELPFIAALILLRKFDAIARATVRGYATAAIALCILVALFPVMGTPLIVHMLLRPSYLLALLAFVACNGGLMRVAKTAGHKPSHTSRVAGLCAAIWSATSLCLLFYMSVQSRPL